MQATRDGLRDAVDGGGSLADAWALSDAQWTCRWHGAQQGGVGERSRACLPVKPALTSTLPLLLGPPPQVLRTEGITGFWKGNALNVLRTAPFKVGWAVGVHGRGRRGLAWVGRGIPTRSNLLISTGNQPRWQFHTPPRLIRS